MEKAINLTGHNYMADFSVVSTAEAGNGTALLKLSPAAGFPRLQEMGIRPGQFAQVKTPGNATFLRRPISICYVDNGRNELWLLVRDAGNGTHAIINAPAGSTLNIILPLGNGFGIDESGEAPLLIGGGVGTAPLLMLGAELHKRGIKPTFLIGARTKGLILLEDNLKEYGDVHISTDDGSRGHHGLVTQNPVLGNRFTSIYCCGPLPMMKAVATIARNENIRCEVSLENVMGCGIGACLCCVEKTVDGNLCVCKDGPVFNINKLMVDSL